MGGQVAIPIGTDGENAGETRGKLRWRGEAETEYGKSARLRRCRGSELAKIRAHGVGDGVKAGDGGVGSTNRNLATSEPHDFPVSPFSENPSLTGGFGDGAEPLKPRSPPLPSRTQLRAPFLRPPTFWTKEKEEKPSIGIRCSVRATLVVQVLSIEAPPPCTVLWTTEGEGKEHFLFFFVFFCFFKSNPV